MTNEFGCSRQPSSPLSYRHRLRRPGDPRLPAATWLTRWTTVHGGSSGPRDTRHARRVGQWSDWCRRVSVWRNKGCWAIRVPILAARSPAHSVPPSGWVGDRLRRPYTFVLTGARDPCFRYDLTLTSGPSATGFVGALPLPGVWLFRRVGQPSPWDRSWNPCGRSSRFRSAAGVPRGACRAG